MPIFEQTYREYDGELRPHMRWRIIIMQELRVLIKSKFFLFMLLAALLHILLMLLLITAYDTIAQDPNSPFAMAFDQIAELAVDKTMFFDFISRQATLVFIVCVFAGSGMICNDFNNNLMEIYFSKPITWIDYVIGKVGTLLIIGLGLTALPAIFLAIMHNLLLPGIETLKETWWWPFAIIAYSLAIVIPSVTCVLASSSLIRSKNFAAVAVFMILIANSAMGAILADVLHNPNYRIVAFPLAIDRLGQQFFKEGRLLFELRWEWSLFYVLAVSLCAAFVMFRKIRQAEIAA